MAGWAALGAVGAATSCAWLGGIEEVTLVAADSDAGTSDAAPEGGATCTLPDRGEAFLRAGNLVPSAAAIDLCVKSAETGSFDDVAPIFASGGSGCPPGLAFKSLTVPFRVEPGNYDVRTVAAGAQDCSDPLGEAKGIVATENRVNTVLAFDGEQSGQVVRALPESQASFNRTQLRFVHALAGHDALDCGVTDSSRLPAKLLTSVFLEVPYGEAAPAGTSDVGTIDDNGYLLYSFQGGLVRFGISEAQQKDALVTLATRFALNSSHTLFAVGKKGDAAYPPALWSCDEGSSADGVLATCGSPVDLSVEVFSAQLTDLFTPFYRERIAFVAEALSQSTADVICLNEVRNPENLAAVVEASKEAFPYSVVSNELTPSASDLTDQNGVEPEPYAEPACTGEWATALMALMDCIDERCARDDGDGHYFIDDGNEGAGCVSDKCTAEGAALVMGGDAQHTCWMCALTQMAGEESTESIRTACTENPETRFAYGGALGLAVLSKHPLGEGQSWLLPSTGWQRGLLHAPVELPNGGFLDLYCGELTLPETGILFPYVGHYGGDAQGDARWVAEQLLQAERVVDLIEERAKGSGAKVVLATTAYAGPAYKEGGKEVLAAQYPEVYAALTQSLLPLVPSDYVPSCTQCIDNPVFSGLDPVDQPSADAWTSHLLGLGIPQQAVGTTQLTFLEPAYEVETSEGTRMIPPSSHYGLRSVLRLTQ